MNEERILKEQLIQSMIYNLFAFTIIFTIFGAIIYNQVKSSIYSDVENELLRYEDTAINIRSRGTTMQETSGSMLIIDRTIGQDTLTTTSNIPFRNTRDTNKSNS